jgi:hypothetical protein
MTARPSCRSITSRPWRWPIGKEVVPGVLVKEVHPRYVLLSEGGVIKRVDLPSDAGVSSGPAGCPASRSMPPPQPVQPQPAGSQQQPQRRPRSRRRCRRRSRNAPAWRR